jgi:hypothetical protein
LKSSESQAKKTNQPTKSIKKAPSIPLSIATTAINVEHDKEIE